MEITMTNVFQCMDYFRSGVNLPSISRGVESYTVKVPSQYTSTFIFSPPYHIIEWQI
jgi:hypothetical protein